MMFLICMSGILNDRINRFHSVIKRNKMDSKQLDRAIRSSGKACFVNYFEYFANSDYSDDDIVSLLIKKEGYTSGGSSIRVSYSRSIIESGHAEEALLIISKSKRLTHEIRSKAISLINEYC